MTDDADRCIVRRWQSPTRYYTAEVARDLFGEWSLRCSWGGLGNRRGAYSFTYMPTYQAAIVALEQINQRRLGRGYQRV